MRLKVYASGAGPKIFISRLKDFLVNHYDVRIVDSKEDIYLSSVWGGKKTSKTAIHVHRVDGVYFDTGHSGRTGMNNRIKVAIRAADAVIFQSRYSQNICRGVLGVKPQESRIIYNGFNENLYDGIEVDKLGYSKMLVACAKWRPLKRPKAIAKSFARAELEDTVLVMMGEIDKKYKIDHPHIKYVGKLKPEETYQYYASSDGLIHISRLDACPNVVVEALCAGKPVLCNNVGGTPELVQNDGQIVKIDPPYDHKSFEMGNPERLDLSRIVKGLKSMCSKDWNIHRPDLFMSETAKNYHEYFSYLLGKK